MTRRDDVAEFSLTPVRTRADLAAVAELLQRYSDELGIDLSFQGFADELQTLPGAYAEPRGALLLCRSDDGTPLGCVAMRPLEAPGSCEMKRLYVTPEARGRQVGSALVSAVIDVAMAVGYSEMKLDTLPSMRAAKALYEHAGFRPCDPYYQTPLPETSFMKLTLENLHR
jgi:GNAT superfamily N-acetyltransferase